MSWYYSDVKLTFQKTHVPSDRFRVLRLLLLLTFSCRVTIFGMIKTSVKFNILCNENRGFKHAKLKEKPSFLLHFPQWRIGGGGHLEISEFEEFSFCLSRTWNLPKISPWKGERGRNYWNFPNWCPSGRKYLFFIYFPYFLFSNLPLVFLLHQNHLPLWCSSRRGIEIKAHKTSSLRKISYTWSCSWKNESRHVLFAWGKFICSV